MPWRNKIGLSAALAALAFSIPSEASSDKRNFTFSSDPAEAVLTVSESGGLLGDVRTYTLAGDGTLRCEHRTRSGEVLGDAREILSFETTRDLLAQLVDAGFVETEMQELRVRMRALGPFGHVEDATTTSVRLILDSYARGDQPTQPVTREFRMEALNAMHRRYPAIEELSAVVRVDERLKALCKPVPRRGAP